MRGFASELLIGFAPSGTAGLRYLLTARHVLSDPNNEGKPHGIVFRVRNLDEMLGGRTKEPPQLMNLGAGVFHMAPYTFSEPHLDLAVVSLNFRHDEDFADDLEASGYEPIDLSEIVDGPSGEAAEIFSVGYPDSVAVLAEVPTSMALRFWSSSAVSLPVFSFGRVAMLHEELTFLWGDVTIYPGNSGGPVVEDGKLVGIVSSQARVEGTRVPFARAIKSHYVKPLIRGQQEKDKRWVG